MSTRALEQRDCVRQKLVALSDVLAAAGSLTPALAGSVVARALLTAWVDEDAPDEDDEHSIVRARRRPEADVLRGPMSGALEAFLVSRGVEPGRARFTAATLANRLLVALEDAASRYPDRLRDEGFARALGVLVASALGAPRE